MSGCSDLTGDIASFCQEQYTIATTSVLDLSPELRSAVTQFGELYQKWKSNNLTGEENEIVKSHVELLNAQNANFNRYAFYKEIPPSDLILALTNRINEEWDFIMAWVDTIFEYSGSGATSGQAYLKGALSLDNTLAWYFLKLITVTYIQRYGYPMPSIDADLWNNKVDVLDLKPDVSSYYGELPNSVTETFKSVYGLEDTELQDKIDTVCLEAITPVRLGDYITEQYRIQQERQDKWDKLGTYMTVAIAAVCALPAIVQATTATYVTLSSSLTKEMSLLSKIELGISTFASSIKTSLSTFLTSINFDTILLVHKVAYLVSADYRTTMKGVYSEIKSVSEALGYGPYFLTLFLQNTRNLVLDVSSSMGMKYDLSQVQWLDTMNGYLKSFSGATYKYVNNPEQLFYDMERWVERPIMDKKGEFLQNIILTIQNSVESIERVATNVTTIRNDLDKLVKQLPESIRSQVQPLIQPYIKEFDEFIQKNYDPYKKQLTGLISGLKATTDKQKSDVSNLISRLKKPAGYLQEIDSFDTEDKEEQERIIEEISTRQLRRNVSAITDLTKPVSAELEKVRKALELVTLEPLQLPEELSTPSRPAGVKAKERETWYIGDY